MLAAPGPVLDEELLPEVLRELLRDRARRLVGGLPGRESHDDLDGMVRTGLRPGGAMNADRGKAEYDQFEAKGAHGFSGDAEVPDDCATACRLRNARFRCEPAVPSRERDDLDCAP